MSVIVRTRTRPEPELGCAATRRRQLEQAGLGPLDWIGPTWLGVIGDLTPEALVFTVDCLARDRSLARAIGHLPPGRERMCAQLHAFRAALDAYAMKTGLPVGANLRFIDAACP